MAGGSGGGRTSDLLISLAVLLIPIVLIVWVFTHNPDRPSVEIPDWESATKVVAQEAPFAAYAPVAVPESWTANRARWTPVGQPGLDGEPVPGDTWQLGFVDERPMYIGLDQSNAPTAAFVAQVTRSGRPDGSSTVEGQQWVRYLSSDGRTRALVATEKDSTVIVSGDLDYTELESFSQTLTKLH